MTVNSILSKINACYSGEFNACENRMTVIII